MIKGHDLRNALPSPVTTLQEKVPPNVQVPAAVAMQEPYRPNRGTRNDVDAEFRVNCGQKLNICPAGACG